MRAHHSNKRQLRGAAKGKWLALKLVMALVVPLLASEVVLADLADGRFGPAQVFDVQRSPAFPEAGSPFTVSNFADPREPPGFTPYTIPQGGWIEFVQVSEDPNCSYSIELYNSNGTFNRQVHSEGKIYGLGQAGFLHVSGGDSPGTGTFVANSGGFQIGDSFSYTPDTGLATCLETTNYPANPNPIDDPTTN